MEKIEIDLDTVKFLAQIAPEFLKANIGTSIHENISRSGFGYRPILADVTCKCLSINDVFVEVLPECLANHSHSYRKVKFYFRETLNADP